MSRLFKSGEITKRIETTPKSIRRWVYRFPEFFSDYAKQENRYQIFYTSEDVLLLATIHHLSSLGYGLHEIESKLKEGFRHAEDVLAQLENDAQLKNSGKPPEVQILEVESDRLRIERNQALENVHRLEEKNEALLREIADLKFELGMTKGELNLLRRQLEQP